MRPHTTGKHIANLIADMNAADLRILFLSSPNYQEIFKGLKMPFDRPEVLNARVHLVWLWFQGVSVRNIAHVTGRSTTTVYRWIRRWSKEGNVYTKPRMGRPLRKGASTWMPWIKIEDGDDGSLSSSGPAAFFFDTLAAKLNFTYTFVRPPDGEWGRSTPNGSFTGMIGMCQRKEIDVALGPFSITYGRSQVADFSLSLYADQIGIFLPRPRRETDISGIAKPLAWQVWTALAVTLGISMVLALISNFLMKRQSLAKTEVSNRLFSIIEISSLIKILLTEAVESLPVATPSRIFLAAWLLGGFILQASYSGVLTSLLAVPKVTVPVDSLEDLVNYGKIPWAIEKGTTLHSSFMQAKSGLYKAINDHGILAPNLYKARHWVKEEKVAVISNSISMRKVISEDYTLTGKCNFYVAKESIISVSLAFAFPKRSPLIQHFDKWLGRLKGSGIISHTMLGISTNISACSVKPGREGGHDTLRFSMMDMAGTFLLYFVGAALGCVALLLEVITKKHWTWKSTR